MESGKIDARLGYQRRELCDKVQGLKDDVGRTISVWRFELVTYFAVGRQRQSFFRYSWARDIATQLFKLVAPLPLTIKTECYADQLNSRLKADNNEVKKF